MVIGSVAQAAGQWHKHGSLQHQTPGLKRSSHLRFLSGWDYRRAPLCLKRTGMCLDKDTVLAAGLKHTLIPAVAVDPFCASPLCTVALAP
ncbi:BEN domain-containing protein 2 [Plecturocebus cupreus]